MDAIFTYLFGAPLTGIAVALLWWLLRGRRRPSIAIGAIPIVVGLLLVLGSIVGSLPGIPMWLPFDLPGATRDWWADYRFTLPLLLGIIGLLLLAFPIRGRAGRGTAELRPRTPLSFADRGWLIAPAVVVAIILIATVTTGMMSRPEADTGRYTMYFVSLGGERGMGSGIYGWYYSVPSLVFLVLMIAVAAVVLTSIARPALGPDAERDALGRTIRTRNVLMVTTGALLLHLGLICRSIAGTASVEASFALGGDRVRFWTTFAATAPAFAWAGVVASVLGLACWAAVALSGIPSQRPAPVRDAA